MFYRRGDRGKMIYNLQFLKLSGKYRAQYNIARKHNKTKNKHSRDFSIMQSQFLMIEFSSYCYFEGNRLRQEC